MTRKLVAAFCIAASIAIAASAAEKGKSRISFTDDRDDVTQVEGSGKPIDLLNVDLSSDGEFVVVAVTVADVPRPTTIFEALLAGVAFDVDNNVKSGGQGFAGAYGNVPGIDFESEIIASVDDGAPSKTSAASVIGVAANGNQSSVLSSGDAPSSPVKGKTFTGKIAYTALGVKSGQTIRVIARELDDRGERFGMFPDALLTLK